MLKYSKSPTESKQEENLETSASVTHIPWWVAIIVVLGALLLLLGAMISKVAPTMLTNASPMTEATRVYADYLFARNLPLAVLLLLLLAIKSRRMLAVLMVLIAFIQVLDVVNDLTRGALVLAPGLLVFAVLFLMAAWRLLGQALWHLDAWR